MFINICIGITLVGCAKEVPPNNMFIEYDAMASWSFLAAGDAGVLDITRVFNAGNTTVDIVFNDALADETIPATIQLYEYAEAHFNHVTVLGTNKTCNVYLCSIFDYANRPSPGVFGVTPANPPQPNGEGPNSSSFVLLGNLYNQCTYPGYIIASGDTFLLCDVGNIFDDDDCIQYSYKLAEHELGHQRAGLSDNCCFQNTCPMTTGIIDIRVPEHPHVIRYKQSNGTYLTISFCDNSKQKIKNSNW